MFRRRPLGAITLLLAWLSFGETAVFAQPAGADKDKARALLLDGREKLKAGDVQGALKVLAEAHAIMHVPTTGLDLAKAQEAAGLLVEAEETALEVARSEPKDDDPSAFANARKAASELAKQLAPRIPVLTVAIPKLPEGQSAEVHVTLDGRALPSAALGTPQRVNPGKHVIEAAATGFVTERQEVELRASESRPVEITMKKSATGATPTGLPANSASSVVPAMTTSSGPSGTRTSAAVSGSEAGMNVPVWTWIAGGIGVAASGVGAVFLVDHLDARNTVATDCPNQVCNESYTLADAQALRGRWNRDLGLTIGLGALGVAGIGVAIVGLATSGPAPKKTGGLLPVEVWVTGTGGGISVKGEF